MPKIQLWKNTVINFNIKQQSIKTRQTPEPSNLFCIKLRHFFSQFGQYCLVGLSFCLQLSNTMFLCLTHQHSHV